MAATAGIMMVASTVSGAYSSASAAKAQGDFQKSQGDLNAELSENAARDAIGRGDVEASRQLVKTRQLIGAQRAAAGAGGTDVNSGSNALLKDEASSMGMIDAMTIKNNAVREAYGYRVQGINSRANGRMAELSGDNEAQATLLVGGMKAAAIGADTYGKSSKPGTSGGNGGYSRSLKQYGSTPRINGGDY